MTRSEQHRGSGVSRMAGMASLLILLILLATAIAAQAQTFQVLHTFTGGDGVGPDAGLTMDRSGRLYGTVNGGTGNFGSVFRMAESGSGWVLNPLHQFVPPLANGDGPDVKAIFGPDGNLYSATAIGGDEQADCENDGQGCGVVFKLQPPATACVSFLCPWTETVLYQFTGQPDGDGSRQRSHLRRCRKIFTAPPAPAAPETAVTAATRTTAAERFTSSRPQRADGQKRLSTVFRERTTGTHHLAASSSMPPAIFMEWPREVAAARAWFTS